VHVGGEGRHCSIPVFRQCATSGNPTSADHSPPLGTGSCIPQSQSAVAAVGAQSSGAAVLDVLPGDVEVLVDLSDVRSGNQNGPDYNPNATGADLTLKARLRITDLANGASRTSPATATDLDFSAPVNCVTRAGPVGATCSLNTSANAVVPQTFRANKFMIAQVFRLRLNDSGQNGVRGDGDDTLLAQQGVFAP
jgi:hypothetical protein